LGIYFSNQLCHKLCKKIGLKSQARIKVNTAGKEHDVYPNLLKDMQTTRPFEKVCTDTTMVRHKSGNFDWNIYIDLYDGTILSNDFKRYNHGHDVANHYEAARLFIKEKEKRGYTDQETIVHSDQGPVYTSGAFNSIFNYTIKRSMSRVGTPTDNPIMEALNGWIKDELRLDYNFYNSDNPHEIIQEYVQYYNTERLAFRIKYKTPQQFRTEMGHK